SSRSRSPRRLPASAGRSREDRRQRGESMKPKSQKLDPEGAARLVQPRDTVLCGFVAGQPVGFLDALGARTDLEDVALYPGLLTLAAANPRMPRSDGFPELGRNRVHLSEVDAWVEHETELVTLPEEPPSPEELAIARRVCELIEPEAILQFGIGAIPDEIARILAERPAGGFGIHTEMIADGVMRLHEAGKVTNRKPLYDGFTVATFALGSEKLY